MKKEPILYSQIIPLLVAFASAGVFIFILILNIHLSNFVFPTDPIHQFVRIGDFLLGLYLYLKTSVDFAVFIGSMMVANPGWKNRVAVEWGTAAGNFVGTIMIIWIWTVFRSTSPVLEGLIVIIASFVLLELAAGSLTRLNPQTFFYKIANKMLQIRRFTAPFLGWMPDVEGAMSGRKAPNFHALLLYSFTVPFVLGSDDFAGYISVFSVVNIFSFASGVILGHTLLLAGIFTAPARIERLMSKPAFSALAVVTFFIIFGIGAYDGGKILLAWGRENMWAFTALLILATAWAGSRKLREAVETSFFSSFT